MSMTPLRQFVAHQSGGGYSFDGFDDDLEEEMIDLGGTGPVRAH